ncbi:carbohydrate kinase [Maridesulfovibrio sp.]|uniref:carbohydrate kinase family protein n=1 Tax=Maridesulfovibrio sp. TaxID=2795000 RepID=UPI002A1881C6|nr:carbohydrate kinase [Maridesulfovibrio sp.]
MADYLVAGLGEILWDVFGSSEELGGAPVNFAYHAGALGADSIAVSTVGSDERGRRALLELRNRGLNTEAVSVDEEHPTGYVKADVDGQGVASYLFPDDIAWDYLTLNAMALSLAPLVDAVCFGTLAQRCEKSRNAIQAFLDASPQALKVYDMNLRQDFYNPEIIRSSLSRADILKLNDEELEIVSSMFALEGGEEEMLKALHDQFNLRLSVLTRGSRGSLLITDAEVVDSLGTKVEKIEDTVGAGDAFTASVVIGTLLGLGLNEICEHAGRLAAYVCTCRGAMPEVPDEFRLIRQDRIYGAKI